MAARRTPTHTSKFGVSRRENHDASQFYKRFSTPQLSDDSTVNTADSVDQIFAHAAESMPEIPDCSVALVVTSPPYFAGKEYEQSLGEGGVPADYVEYLEMLTAVFAECVRVLEPGGRIAVNVANLGRKPFRSLASDVTTILQDRLRLLLRGEVVWVKGRGATGSCAWGSFQRPGNPVLRDLSERVVIASKGRFDRAVDARTRAKRGLPHLSTLSRDEFMEATTDVWEIASESATRVGHPAPFPVELPERLIHLYTYRDDLVLDPFMGSGSTAIAARRAGRHYVGYDLDPAYVAVAQRRIDEATTLMSGPVVELGPGRGTGDPVRDGASSVELAQRLLARAGFSGVETKVKPISGVEIALRAIDPAGRPWWFDVVGGRTVARSGLARADLLWRAVGTASVAHEVDPKIPFVILTTELAPRGSSGASALRALTGVDKPITAIVELLAPDADAHLARLVADS